MQAKELKSGMKFTDRMGSLVADFVVESVEEDGCSLVVKVVSGETFYFLPETEIENG